MTMPAPPSLSVDGLRFAYPRVSLFDGWSHDFGPGLHWLRGDNGSGKSTLLQLLGGAREPDGGTIRVDGVDAATAPLDHRRAVYWCGPDGVAFDHLKPAEFFGFVAGLYPAFDANLATTWVEALGLELFMPRRIDQLSTGTRRKVAVTAAVASGAKVVLLDEPLAGLDRASLRFVQAELALAARRNDRIWIVTSHEPLGEAAAAASNVELPARP